MSQLNRRRFIAAGTAAAAASTLPACSREDASAERPEGVPVGPFGEDSTAEEVTAGLDLAGQTALVTGCNSGLGYEAMRVLATRGAHVIGTGRTLEKATAACASVAGHTTPVELELSDFESVVACSEAVKALDTPIDMLMLNAGIMALPELEQVYGLERQFVVNHLGHFILGTRLIEQVKAAPRGRVIVLSSSGHAWAPGPGIEFDNLSGERDYDPNKMYGQSKMANGLFSLELARRLEGTNATSNSVHPGVILTNLGRHFPKWQIFMARLIGWTFMKSIEAGAATQCYVATAPALAGVSGYYFADCNPLRPDPRMEDPALAARLWEVSEELTRPYLA